MEEYREIELNGTKLRVYRDGTIWRLVLRSNRYGKKGEWKLAKQTIDTYGYLKCEVSKKQYKSHRLIGYVYLDLELENPTKLIDHKNRIRNDNRVENLHIVNYQGNVFNSNIKGYSFHKPSGKWRVRIQVNGKRKNIGMYDTEEEASNAYHQAKSEHHII